MAEVGGGSPSNSSKVFVILLNWNGWEDTLECLASLAKLDYPSYEVLVVDNASTDNSVTKIREAYPNLMLFENSSNLGFSGGNNTGIRYALTQEAEYIWLLNSDTVADLGALSAMVDKARNDASIGAVGSVLYHMRQKDVVQMYGGGRVRWWMGTSRAFEAPVPSRELHYVAAASLLIRGEVFESTGLLDEGFFMYWEDTDYGFRLRKSGWKLAAAPESKVWHKGSAIPSEKNPLHDLYFNVSAIRFFRKHYSISSIPILVGIGGRIFKRMVRRDWKRARAVWQAAKVTLEQR